MLIPRFSLRTSLILLTVCAFFFLVVGRATRGDAWAIVITFAVLSVFVALAVQAMFYLLARAFGKIIGAQISPAKTSQGGIQSSTDLLNSTDLDSTMSQETSPQDTPESAPL